MGKKSKRNSERLIRLKTAEQQLEGLGQIKLEISLASEAIIQELRKATFLLTEVIKSRYNVQKLHSTTGVGDIDLIYDDVILVIKVALNNDLFPDLFELVIKIKDLIENLENEINDFSHFKRRKRLQKIDQEVKQWKENFLNFADFILGYNKIIDYHLLNSEQLEKGINKIEFIRKFRSMPLFKETCEFLTNIIYTESSKIGKSNQLIAEIDDYLVKLKKLYFDAIKKMQIFELHSIKNINYLTNRVSKRISERKFSLTTTENIKKWKKTYFPIFIDYWDKNILQIFQDLNKGIRNFQSSLNENIKSEPNFLKLKQLGYHDFCKFTSIIQNSLTFLGNLWRKWINNIDFSSCSNSQFQLFSRIERTIYKSHDFLLENLQSVYYDAQHLEKFISIDKHDGSIDRFFLDASLNNFYNLTKTKLSSLEIKYYEKNTNVYNLIFESDSKNFDSELNQTIDHNKMLSWIGDFNHHEKFAVCDFNWNNSEPQHETKLANGLNFAVLDQTLAQNAQPSFEILKQTEIKYPFMISFLVALFLILQCFYKNSNCNIKNKTNRIKKNRKFKTSKLVQLEAAEHISSQNSAIFVTEEISLFKTETHAGLDYKNDFLQLVPLEIEQSQLQAQII